VQGCDQNRTGAERKVELGDGCMGQTSMQRWQANAGRHIPLITQAAPRPEQPARYTKQPRQCPTQATARLELWAMMLRGHGGALT
jgi:hypothetical protein